MDSRVVLVTGSSSGIGKATALLFAKKGYKVVVHGSKSQEKVDKVVDECNKLSPNNNKALGLVVDFSDPDNADIIVTKTIQHFGRLDVLINNAGIYIESTFAEQDKPTLYSQYKRARNINTDATVNVSLSAIEHLRKSDKHPNIVFVSSVDTVRPLIGAFTFCVSKAALTMFAKCLAIELAPKIRCNVVSVGPVDTPIFEGHGFDVDYLKTMSANRTLLKKMGEPEDAAEAICYLAEDKARWITGTDFHVDAGFCLSDVYPE